MGLIFSKLKTFTPLFLFWDQKISTYFVCGKFCLSFQNHHMKPVLKTCNYVKVFVKIQFGLQEVTVSKKESTNWPVQWLDFVL